MDQLFSPAGGFEPGDWLAPSLCLTQTRFLRDATHLLVPGVLLWAVCQPFAGLAADAGQPPQFREGSRTDPAINPIPRRLEWPNDPPADGPFERSKDIRGIVFTGRYPNYTGADTWYFQGAPDGHHYSCWTDGEIDGFRCNSNIRAQATGQARIEGSDP
jgi:hypothetical protein